MYSFSSTGINNLMWPFKPAYNSADLHGVGKPSCHTVTKESYQNSFCEWC